MRPLLAYDEVFLSPHLDDAALSCGGQIAQASRRGAKVLVITLFTADAPDGELSPLAAELHQLWAAGPNPFAERRREDQQSCAILGADCEHWNFADAIYRRDAEGAWLYPDERALLAPPRAADAGLIDELARRFSAFSGMQVRGPLAIGGHVDHRLVREALEKAALPGCEFYEDFPYARSRKKRWQAMGLELGWSKRRIALEPEDLEQKIAAIAAFPSQLGAVFTDAAMLRHEVEKFTRARGGELLYSRR